MLPDRPLLGPADPDPVIVTKAAGGSPFLLVCDHAGRRVPACLGDLGVSAADWERHIAWDIGAAGLTAGLRRRLDAVSVEQAYSRLVIDCNRAPGHPTSIPTRSDGTAIPGNQGISAAARTAREAAIFHPYHAAIAAELDRRAGKTVALIAVHSFTPVFGGETRAMQAGVLHNRDPRLGHAVAERLAARGFIVGDNAPYALSDESDYTVPVHAERRGIPYLELEVRQDLLADLAGQEVWAALMAEILPEAARASL